MKTDGKYYAYKFARERILEAGFAYVLPPLFCMLRKTEQLSSSLLLEANSDGVELSPAVEMDSVYKKIPKQSNLNVLNRLKKC